MSDLTQLLRSAEPAAEPGFDARDIARRVQERERRRARVTVATTVGIVGIVAVLGAGTVDLWGRPAPGVVLSEPASPFVGTWTSIDTDGSSQTMEIDRADGTGYEVDVRDDFATTCAGAPSTLTGTGLLETDVRLVIAQADLTCDDGTIPSIGPAPQAELADYTLELETATDEIVDSLEVVWWRAGTDDQPDGAEEPLASSPRTVSPSTSATSREMTSGGMWPQSTREEVRAAQELADAGDPAHTWQLDATLAAGGEPWGAEIFTRFIEEELGWEEFISGGSFGGGYAGGEGSYDHLVFVRCAPGETNPLGSLYTEVPAAIRGCAPTIDDLTYETVGIAATQPERRGPLGIWVVNRWDILQSSPAPSSPFNLLYPDFLAEIRVQQVAPPSDTEVTTLLQAFLQARVDGAGAEQYLLREPPGSWAEDTELPLLYTTTGGTSYERFETEHLQGPVWPTGWREVKVRLFAEDGTVIEQHVHVVGRDGQIGLVYGYASTEIPTTEDGRSLAVPVRAFGDTVTFTAAPPFFPLSDGSIEIKVGAGSDARVVVSTDPRPDGRASGCEDVLVPDATADARALARSIESDPTFEITGTGSLPIDFDGLQMDSVVKEDGDCYASWRTDKLPSGESWRMRLYLIDYPDMPIPPSGWSPQVLTIAVIAPETDFERVLAEATPILDSLEFHPG